MFFPFDSSIASTVYASVRALAVGLLTIDHRAFVSRYTANLVVHLTASYVTKKYYQIEDLLQNNISLYLQDSKFAKYVGETQGRIWAQIFGAARQICVPTSLVPQWFFYNLRANYATNITN